MSGQASLPEVVVTATSLAPPAIATFAAPTCVVEVYPYEGGKYVLTGGQILSLATDKSVRGITPGTFEIDLAPGGPNGAESVPTWSEIVTPNSFVLIGMQRGAAPAIVMAGIVTSVTESQQWLTAERGSQAQRTQVIRGQDFTWFFTSFNYFLQAFSGLVAGTAEAAYLGDLPNALPVSLGQGLIGGNNPENGGPAQVGSAWLNTMMVGPQSLMANTFVPYQGRQVLLRDALAQSFESYPHVYIPAGDNFWAAEGTWAAKFAGIFPFPWYEFFVTTAPKSAYFSNAAVSGGFSFTMQSLPGAQPVSPVVVARVNPAPLLTSTGGASQQVALAGIDATRWNELDTHSPHPGGFIQSSISFSSAGARNFYMLNPTNLLPRWGDTNTAFGPYMFFYCGGVDVASVHRYGFKPEIGTFYWLVDLSPDGKAAQNPAVDIKATTATLTAHLMSWWEPQPLMASAQVVLPLRPDILPGDRFHYQPFKDDNTEWEFYIDSVSHRFVFGGRPEGSVTALGLSRGLPRSVYQDSGASGMLRNVHVGNAQRLNGSYVSGVPAGLGPTAQLFGAPEQIMAFLGQIAQAYVSPQTK
ncbi:MAG: hypothetical protein M0Z28_08305 [Rhodospirillales bacterium]|nr:hypothetical protein [Rhodospirillales bacterium]